ncbi:MAG: tetratricopeptide repeat protein [Candidatus Aminicenantes bacterium]
MRCREILSWIIFFLFVGITFYIPGFSQYREYYIYGKIVDTENKPLSDVEIFLRDIKSSRSYRVTTDEKGEYRLVGLPHGVYGVTIQKEGYQTRTDEWNFSTPQDRMQKVEVSTVVMVTEKQIQEMERAEEAEAELDRATQKLRQGDIDGAVEILTRMIDRNPEDANAHYLLGISYLKKEMISEAIRELTKTTELSPSFPGAYHQLGLCYQRKNEPEKALQFYEKALELEPESTESRYNAGLILFEMKRVPEALSRFEKALEIRPDEPEFLEMAGRCHIHQGNLDQAIQYLEKAKQAYSDQQKTGFLEELIKKLKEQKSSIPKH